LSREFFCRFLGGTTVGTKTWNSFELCGRGGTGRQEQEWGWGRRGLLGFFFFFFFPAPGLGREPISTLFPSHPGAGGGAAPGKTVSRAYRGVPIFFRRTACQAVPTLGDAKRAIPLFPWFISTDCKTRPTFPEGGGQWPPGNRSTPLGEDRGQGQPKGPAASSRYLFPA